MGVGKTMEQYIDGLEGRQVEAVQTHKLFDIVPVYFLNTGFRLEYNSL